MFRAFPWMAAATAAIALPVLSDTKFQLTIENIMQGPHLVGYEPAQVRWSGDSSKVYFQWKKAADSVNAPMDTYAANRDGSGLRKLSDDEAREAPPAGVEMNEDRTESAYSEGGDIFLIENATGKRRQVTKTADAETNPRFVRGGHRITFLRGGNLYAMSLDNGDLEQLTDIRQPATGGSAAAPAAGGGRGGTGGGRGGRGGAGGGRGATDEPKGTESQQYLKKEQREIFDLVGERARLKEEADAKQKKLTPRKPYTLQARQTLGALELSPDGKYVFGLVSETSNGVRNSPVPNWITDSTFPEDLAGRPRVGDALPQRHLVILNVETGEARNVDHGEVGTPAAQVEDGSGCGGGAGGFGGGGFGTPVLFAPDGSKAVFNARSEDNKSCWIFALDPATAKARVLFKDHDDAWIGGPGGGQGWLGDNQTYYFTSERDGFNHLYEVAWDGGEPKQLTSGKWEIDHAVLSLDRSKFYLTTSEGSFYERHLWSMNALGGERTRITKAAGGHQATLSPDEKWIADIYSYVNKPPELQVQANDPGAQVTRITDSPAPEFASYKWTEPPIVEITTRDGAKLPANLYKPAGYRKGGPAVIFVHGSGYLQNVDKLWSTAYYHEYLFHHFLMEHGYLVLAVDYRASRGYGRDWRTAIYRHMGGKDLDDQVDAAKWLISEQGVNPKKIGIYGGSYGGFITLMAMFTQPDVFAAGAALRPVSDWAYYNQGYTGNILNQPQSDAEAYKQSSPIYFAEGLKGHLLICHGMVDTNVHFVDTVRLVQRLIDLHKDNWELASYPVEDHTFVQPSSWTDEYKRIFKLFETTLK